MLKAILEWLYATFVVAPKPVIPDTVRETEAAPPRPDIKIVEPVVLENPPSPQLPWYMTGAMKALLLLILKHEGGKAGYNADYRNDDRWTLSNYNFDEVRSLSRRQVTVDKEASSAIGGYQFLTKTLDSLKASLHLTGKERFTNAFQDDLAVALMIRRGLLDYLRGRISLGQFGNNMAMEWASLPVLVATKRGNRNIKVGQSYYAGDGLNASFHKPAVVAEALEAMKTSLVKVMPKELQS